MGVYVRKDSPFYWLYLERPRGQRGIHEPTKIARAAPTRMARTIARDQANELYTLRMAELARADYDLPARTETITFNAYADWWEQHKLPKRRGHIRDAGCVAQLRKYFGRDDLTAINDQRVSEFETKRLAEKVGRPPKKGPDTRRSVRPNTVNRDVDVLKSMLRDACPRWLKVSVLRGRKKLRVVTRTKRVLSEAEELRLIAALPPMDQAFYVISRDSLARWSNVYNLKWTDDHGTYFALEDSKTGPYEATISRRGRLALDSLPRKKPGELHAEYIFWHRRGAKNLNNARTAWRHMLERACGRAGIPYGREHGGITHHTATRATGATRMFRQKVDLGTVMEVGNWKDARSVVGYKVTSREERLRAVNKISAVGVGPHTRTRKPQTKARRASEPVIVVDRRLREVDALARKLKTP